MKAVIAAADLQELIFRKKRLCQTQNVGGLRRRIPIRYLQNSILSQYDSKKK